VVQQEVPTISDGYIGINQHLHYETEKLKFQNSISD